MGRLSGLTRKLKKVKQNKVDNVESNVINFALNPEVHTKGALTIVLANMSDLDDNLINPLKP